MCVYIHRLLFRQLLETSGIFSTYVVTIYLSSGSFSCICLMTRAETDPFFCKLQLSPNIRVPAHTRIKRQLLEIERCLPFPSGFSLETGHYCIEMDLRGSSLRTDSKVTAQNGSVSCWTCHIRSMHMSIHFRFHVASSFRLEGPACCPCPLGQKTTGCICL